MNRYLKIAAATLMMAACSDGFEPTSVDPSLTIQIDGNVSYCGPIDFASCFAIVDQQFKDMYEQNNRFSRTGEALYNDASNSNNELASVYLAPTRTVTEAIRYLDRFTSQIERALSQGTYSACAANELLERAAWLRAKLVAGSADMTGGPSLDWCISPVTVTGTGSTTAGVVLTFNDRFHYTQMEGNIIDFRTYVYFNIELPNGGGIVSTTPYEQFGPTTYTYAHNVTAEGSYTYRVQQCDTRLEIGCSAWATVTVVVSATGGGPGDPGACAHDNRNGLYDPKDKTKPKCEKTDKIRS